MIIARIECFPLRRSSCAGLIWRQQFTAARSNPNEAGSLCLRGRASELNPIPMLSGLILGSNVMDFAQPSE